jgi:predicted TIM-barrel fold metal-dependent hydrolase
LTEGMGIPLDQMVFGTDYPYGIGFWDVDANIRGLAEVKGIEEVDKEKVFWGNAKRLWGGRSKALDGI